MTLFHTVILSGGGMLGCAHVGFLDYLQQNNKLVMRNIVGTSVGSLVGLWLACGMQCKEMMELLCSMNSSLLKVSDDGIASLSHLYGLDDGEYFSAFIMDSLLSIGVDPQITFRQLYSTKHIRLVVVICNVSSGNAEYVDYDTYPHMSIVDAVRASCSIPFVVGPFRSGGGDKLWVDGGLIDNYPIEWTCRTFGTHGIIGCQLVSWEITKDVQNFGEYLLCLMGCLLRKGIDGLPYTVRVDCSEASVFDFDCVVGIRQKLYDLGFSCTREYVNCKLLSAGPTTHKRSYSM